MGTHERKKTRKRKLHVVRVLRGYPREIARSLGASSHYATNPAFRVL